MPGRIGFFRPESRTKGVNVAKGHGHAFGLQLARYGQAGHFPKEVLAIVYLPILGARSGIRIKGGYMEHFSGSFTVAAGNQRCVGIDKAPLVEKAMDGKRRHRTDAEYRVEGIGSGTQMGNSPQIFQGMAFFLQRVIRS